MTDVKELEAAIARAGVTKRELARALGISETALYNKLCAKAEFKASEIFIMQKKLNLTNEQRDNIFFAGFVENISTKLA